MSRRATQPTRLTRGTVGEASAAGDNDRLATAVIVVTALVLSLGDALIRQISADFTLWQIFVVRSAIATPVLVALVKTKNRPSSLKPRYPFWTTVRSLMLTSMWVAYYTALPHVAFSVAAAAYYTLPIFITLFAALFVGDRIGSGAWIAVGLGFTGVLLLLRPDLDGFNSYVLLPILAAILYALAMIITRTKCRDESPLVLSLALNFSFIAVGSVAVLGTAAFGPALETESDAFLFGPWTTMGTGEWIAVTILSAALVIGSVGTAFAYQIGRSSLIATFDFSYVPFATVWGFLIFSEIPNPASALGISLVVAAGVLAVRRESTGSPKPSRWNRGSS